MYEWGGGAGLELLVSTPASAVEWAEEALSGERKRGIKGGCCRGLWVEL